MSEIPNTPETPGATKEQVLDYLYSVEAQLSSFLVSVRTTIGILNTPES